jgi:hypothetical protein
MRAAFGTIVAFALVGAPLRLMAQPNAPATGERRMSMCVQVDGEKRAGPKFIWQGTGVLAYDSELMALIEDRIIPSVPNDHAPWVVIEITPAGPKYLPVNCAPYPVP